MMVVTADTTGDAALNSSTKDLNIINNTTAASTKTNIDVCMAHGGDDELSKLMDLLLLSGKFKANI